MDYNFSLVIGTIVRDYDSFLSLEVDITIIKKEAEFISLDLVDDITVITEAIDTTIMVANTFIDSFASTTKVVSIVTMAFTKIITTDLVGMVIALVNTITKAFTINIVTILLIAYQA